ncbi:MAG: Na+/H+ antiporter subunit E [Candidatus Dormibacteraceae bacterium]
MRVRSARVRTVLFWSVWFVLLFGLYLLLVDTLIIPELGVGLASAALGATGVEAIRKQGRIGFAPRWRWLLALRVLPGRVLVDLARVFGVLGQGAIRRQAPRGAVLGIPYDAGEGDDGRVSARHVVTTLATSFTPGTIVLGIDRDLGLLLVHELGRDGDADRAQLAVRL